MLERPARWLIAATAAVAVVGTGAAIVTAAARAGGPIEIGIRYSAFSPGTVHATAGQDVTFVIRNDDPIDHEWIVGDEAVHQRHRTGTEPVHADRPTEVTVAAGDFRRTTVRFDQPGTFRFICHLPGHEAYGMVGTVVVTP
jgi:uncharacterized cupredoxin-like copper-binding protein